MQLAVANAKLELLHVTRRQRQSCSGELRATFRNSSLSMMSSALNTSKPRAFASIRASFIRSTHGVLVETLQRCQAQSTGAEAESYL